MMGFRYRCQQCHDYQLCQDCFWRGHAGGSHSNQHQMKEYTSWVRPGRAGGPGTEAGRWAGTFRAGAPAPSWGISLRPSPV